MATRPVTLSGCQIMHIANELVREFFERKKVWALPLALTLLALSALVVAADSPNLAPFCYCSGRF
jgi:Family of unknown function (DUF5989)